MKFNLRDGEKIVKEGPANLHKGKSTVGGALLLTNQRLIFTSHKFNFQDGHATIEIRSIHSCRPQWTKLFGVIPIFPNSLAVLTNDGREYSFVLYNREIWTSEIEAQQATVI